MDTTTFKFDSTILIFIFYPREQYLKMYLFIKETIVQKMSHSSSLGTSLFVVPFIFGKELSEMAQRSGTRLMFYRLLTEHALNGNHTLVCGSCGIKSLDNGFIHNLSILKGGGW